MSLSTTFCVSFFKFGEKKDDYFLVAAFERGTIDSKATTPVHLYLQDG